MKVAEGMSERVLMIGPAHTLREAARMMAAYRRGLRRDLENLATEAPNLEVLEMAADLIH